MQVFKEVGPLKVVLTTKKVFQFLYYKLKSMLFVL